MLRAGGAPLKVRPSLAQAALGFGVVASVAIVAWRIDERSHLAAVRTAEVALQAMPLDAPAPPVGLWNRAGEEVPLASYRGRLVFVNFWATWCGPCRAEMASLIELRRSVDAADVAFVSIAEDDTWPPLDAYLAANPLPFDVFRDQPPRVEDKFETRAYPTSFLIDRDGRVIYRFDGPRDWNTAAARDLFALHGAQILAR